MLAQLNLDVTGTKKNTLRQKKTAAQDISFAYIKSTKCKDFVDERLEGYNGEEEHIDMDVFFGDKEKLKDYTIK